MLEEWGEGVGPGGKGGWRQRKGRTGSRGHSFRKQGAHGEEQLGMGMMGSCWGKPASQGDRRGPKEGQDGGMGWGLAKAGNGASAVLGECLQQHLAGYAEAGRCFPRAMQRGGFVGPHLTKERSQRARGTGETEVQVTNPTGIHKV